MRMDIEENVRKNVPWAQLPAHIKQVGCYIIISKQTVLIISVVCRYLGILPRNTIR